MALPTQALPMQWGTGVIHRDPPQYPEFMVQDGSGPQPTAQYPAMPRMSKSQSDSKFRSEQAKLQVERRHNSQGTNSGRALPVYSGVHQTEDHQSSSGLQTQEQCWPHGISGDYWSREHLVSGGGWSHNQSGGSAGWSHGQPMGAAAWSQNQMAGEANWSRNKMEPEDCTKSSWPSSLQESPDHSHVITCTMCRVV